MSGSADQSIRGYLTELIARSRQLERDNDYARRYLNALSNNVLGADGISLQNKAKNSRGGLNKLANQRVEDAWKRWGKKKNCTLNQEDGWVDVQNMVMRTTPRDGGIFWRPVMGADNDFGFALELIEIDQLDFNYTGIAPNGNMIFMGVERNSMNRVTAYHMFTDHPGNTLSRNRHKRERIPSTDIHLYYVKERVNQSIGVPWFSSAMTRMHFLNKYEEAEVIAARAGAEKGGWFQSDRGEQFAGDEETSVDEDGNKITNTLNDFEPGAFDELPAGMSFTPYNPTHPNQVFPDFVRGTLYGISAGLNIDYATLTNDLSEANYSSMRSGKLESQETWKGTQGHLIRNFVQEVFDKWLPMAALSGELGISYGQLDSINNPLFRERRWPWVDPSKDVNAAVLSVMHGLDTKTNIVAQNGGDYEDNVDTRKEEMGMEKEAGVTFGEPKPVQGKPEDAKKPAGKKPDAEDDDEEETEDDEEEGKE